MVASLNRRQHPAAFSSQRSTVFQAKPLDARNGGFAHALDAERGNLVEHRAPVLEPVVGRAFRQAERLSAIPAQVATALARLRLVEPVADNGGNS